MGKPSPRPPPTGNNAARLSDNRRPGAARARVVIEYPPHPAQAAAMMTQMLRTLTLALALALPVTAQAACYADYKAKKDGPLRLHYGVMQVADAACAGPPDAAAAEVAARLAAHGWTLLRVMSVFGPEGLAQRSESAGQFHLRF
jgi:hypothetical protein